MADSVSEILEAYWLLRSLNLFYLCLEVFNLGDHEFGQAGDLF
ncbi:hypothetical protein ACQ4M3_41620 [Leptolyngbya sp. AN03gr2]